MKYKNEFLISILFLLVYGCSDVNEKTKKLLGTWEIVKMGTGKELTQNAVKIDFIQGSYRTVNKFYLYTQDGLKYEGQWQFYKDKTFYMKFHEGGSGIHYEDQLYGTDYNIFENQFSFTGTFDDKDENYCSIVLKR